MPATALLATGGVAVIVGTRSTNFPDAWRTDSRLQFWDSTDPATESRALPHNTRAILLSRFVSHALFDRLTSAARANPAIKLIHGLQGTGALKRRIAELLGTGTDTAGQPLSPAAVQARQHESVVAFVEAHADLSGASNSADEGRRLFVVAGLLGLVTTAATLTHHVRALKRKRGAGDRPASVSAPTSRLDDVLQTFDDAIAGLTLCRAFLAETHAGRREFEQRLDELRQLFASGGGTTTTDPEQSAH